MTLLPHAPALSSHAPPTNREVVGLDGTRKGRPSTFIPLCDFQQTADLSAFKVYNQKCSFPVLGVNNSFYTNSNMFVPTNKDGTRCSFDGAKMLVLDG